MEASDIQIINTVIKFDEGWERIEVSEVMLDVATLEEFVDDIV
jgi:hypothetical protein